MLAARARVPEEKATEMSGSWPHNSVRRRLAWSVLGLGLAVAACGRSARTPEPKGTDGGCASDCTAAGASPEGGAAPDAAAGGSAQAGTFSNAGSGSAQAGTFSSAGSSSAGAGGVPVVQITCISASLQCVDGDLYTCDSAGTSASLTKDCGPDAHCQTLYPGDCVCTLDLCVPGSVVCDGNLLKTCNDDGMLPRAGTDCANLACDNGVCQPKICDPHTSFTCRNGDVHLCLGQGATTKLARTCMVGTTCQGEPPTLGCMPLRCLPDSTACIDNQLGQCDKSGNALSRLDQDCAAKGDVCDSAGGCSPSAVDYVGGTTQTTTASFAGTFIDVHSRRHLTKLDFNLRPTSGDVLVHWEINRIVGAVEVEQIAVADSVAHLGDTTVSTTALSCTLETGQRYRLVASFDPPAEVDFDVVHALPIVSFGTVSSFSNDDQIYAMRVTTTLP